MNSVFKIIIAMVLWGTIGIFVKNIDLPSIEIVFFRAITASIFLFIGNLLIKKLSGNKVINKNSKKHSKKDICLLVISGVGLAVNWLLLFQAYKFTTVANATLSYYSAPIFVILLSPIVLKEKVTFKKLLSVLVAMIGLILIVSQQSSSTNGNYMHMKGITYGILGAVTYATIILLNKSIKEFEIYNKTVIQIFISSLVLLPVVIYRNNLHITSIKELVILIILGIIHTGVAYLLYFSSIEHISAQKIAVLSYIDPISAVIFGTIFLSEPLTAFTISGGALILSSAFFGSKNIEEC